MLSAKEIDDIVRENQTLRAQVDELSAGMTKLQRDYTHVLERLKLWLRRAFGSKAERIHPGQIEIDYADLADVVEAEQPDALLQQSCEAPDAEEGNRKAKRSRHGRKKLARELPRVRIEHDLTPEECTCLECSAPMAKIGEDTKEVLEYKPASLFVEEHVRPKYACSKCQAGVLSAPPPPSVIPKGLPGPGLLAYVLVSKYQHHLPLNRLETILANEGADVSRSTMCDWVAACADAFRPLFELLVEEVLRSFVIQCDDTLVKCLDHPERAGGHGKAALWTYVGDRKDVVYDFTPTRSRDGPMRMLAKYAGYLQGDAFAGFDVLYRGGKIVEVGCMAHARRKFFESIPSAPKLATRMVALIQKLYRVEKDARTDGVSAQERARRRMELSTPILSDIEKLLQEIKASALPKSLLGQAAKYMDNQWIALNRFVQDGRLEIDNNGAERALRVVAVGRRNWLFTGTIEAGQRAAVIYSFIETCKRLEIDPFEYLRDVLGRLPVTPSDQLRQLLPREWQASRAVLSAAG